MIKKLTICALLSLLLIPGTLYPAGGKSLAFGRKEPYRLDELPLAPGTIKEINNFQIRTFAEVQSTKTVEKTEKQTLSFAMVGLHKKACQRSMPEVSNFPNYKNVIDIIQESRYDDEAERVHLEIGASVLKTTFVLDFKLPPIKGPGVYPFEFDTGTFTGLKGEVHVSQQKTNCLVFIGAYWEGQDTGLPNLLLEVFLRTASRMGMEKIWRVTGSPVN